MESFETEALNLAALPFVTPIDPPITSAIDRQAAAQRETDVDRLWGILEEKRVQTGPLRKALGEDAPLFLPGVIELLPWLNPNRSGGSYRLFLHDHELLKKHWDQIVRLCREKKEDFDVLSRAYNRIANNHPNLVPAVVEVLMYTLEEPTLSLRDAAEWMEGLYGEHFSSDRFLKLVKTYGVSVAKAADRRWNLPNTSRHYSSGGTVNLDERTYALMYALGEEAVTVANLAWKLRDRDPSMERFESRVNEILDSDEPLEAKRAATQEAVTQFLLDMARVFASDPQKMAILQQDDDAKGLAILGQAVDESVLGSKAGSFYDFSLLGLPYPEGVVVNRETARRLSSGSTKEEEGTDGPWAARSSPAISMPGMLTSVVGVLNPKALLFAVGQVVASWDSEKAAKYRNDHAIPEDAGLGVILQRRIRTDDNERCAAGVVFSRDPDTGQPGLSGRFAVKTKGEDLVSGRVPGLPIDQIKEQFPEAYAELELALMALENKRGWPQEVEFGIEDGKLYFLQRRDIHFAPAAEMRYLSDALAAGVISERQYAARLTKLQERVALRNVYRLRDRSYLRVIGKGLAAIPGAMAGRIAFTSEGAKRLAQGGPVILLVTEETQEELLLSMTDFPEVGLMTLYGNASSHEAVITRAAGIPAIINVQSPEELSNLKEGDWIVMDGSRNEILLPEKSIADPKGLLEKDGVFQDASYGVDLPAYVKEVSTNYLEPSGAVKESVTVEQLIELNAKAEADFLRHSASGNLKELLLANLRKHAFHNLLLQKVEETNAYEYQVISDLKKAIEEIREHHFKTAVSSLPPGLAGIQSLQKYSTDEDIRLTFAAAWAAEEQVRSDPQTGAALADAIAHMFAQSDERSWGFYYALLSILRQVYKQALFTAKEESRQALLEMGSVLGRPKKVVQEDLAYFSRPDISREVKARYIDENTGFITIGPFRFESMELNRLEQRLASFAPEGLVMYDSIRREGDNHNGYTTYHHQEIQVPQEHAEAVIKIISELKGESVAEGRTRELPGQKFISALKPELIARPARHAPATGRRSRRQNILRAAS